MFTYFSTTNNTMPSGFNFFQVILIKYQIKLSQNKVIFVIFFVTSSFKDKVLKIDMLKKVVMQIVCIILKTFYSNTMIKIIYIDKQCSIIKIYNSFRFLYHFTKFILNRNYQNLIFLLKSLIHHTFLCI